MDTCSNDLHNVSKAVANWLNTSFPGHPLFEPESEDRCSDCSINHDTTGMLLCPILYDWSDSKYILFVTNKSGSILTPFHA